jgi:hypothetical protein
MDPMVVTVGRMVRFLSMVVMARRCGPSGGDDLADGAIPGCGGDGIGGGQGGGVVVPTTEEERDGVVPRPIGEVQVDGVVPERGDGVEAVGVAAAWTR